MKPMKHSLPYLCAAALLLIVDQLVKHWVRNHIALFESRDFLPGLIELTYVQNTGAAFSILEAHTWLLTLVSAVAVVVLLVLILRGLFPDLLGKISLCLVLGGAAGNLIDRALFGYVVDMFRPTFINFAVFNVADIGVTCGGALLCIYVLFFWQKKRKSGEAAP